MPETELTITLWPAHDADPVTLTLLADESGPVEGSTLADPAGAWAALEDHGFSLLFPVLRSGPARVGMDRFFGPEQARISGTYRGQTVDASFSRTNSLLESRWQALAPLFAG